jgi:hypothetical protein
MSSRLFIQRGLLGLTAGVLLLAAAAAPAQEQLTVYPREISNLPADLAMVPRDTAWFLSLQVAELWKSPSARLLRRTPESEAMCKAILTELGFEPGEVERLTVFAQHKETLCVVRTVKPANAIRIARALAPRAKPGSRQGRRYLVDEESWRGVAFLDDHTVLFGQACEVENLLDNRPHGDGVLASALDGVPLHEVSLGLTAQELARFTGSQGQKACLPWNLGCQGWNIAPDVTRLFRCQMLTATIDFHARDTTIQVRFRYAGERQARSADQLLQKQSRLVLALTEQSPEAPREDMPAVPGLPSCILRFQRALAEAFAQLRTEQKESDVRAFLRVKAPDGVAAAVCMALDSGTSSCPAPCPENRVANARKIGLAMLEYNRKYGRLPAAASYTKEGQALLSWRVTILPFLGEKELYRQFHLDEPWDSEHNRKLVARMPAVFMALDDEPTPTTAYQVPVGKGTAFTGKKGKRLADLKDGPGQTLLVVEAGRRVPWTKPEDYHYSADKPLRRFGAPNPIGILGDGQVIALPGAYQPTGPQGRDSRFVEGTGVTERDLRALFTRDGKDGAQLPALLSRCYLKSGPGQQPQPWNGPAPMAAPPMPIQPAIYQPGMMPGYPGVLPAAPPIYPTPPAAPGYVVPPVPYGADTYYPQRPDLVRPMPRAPQPQPAKPYEDQPR